MEIYFFSMCLVVAIYFALHVLRKPSEHLHSVDVIIPAFNEAPCLEQSVRNLLLNPYVHRVICVNDGSTDDTADVLARLADDCGGRLVVVHQQNTGKGGALMNGLNHVTTTQVFLTDADTYVAPGSKGLGYLLAEVERGADAVGGIPSSNLQGAGLLPHVRATVKLPMIAIKRTFQQLLGGAPFIISGACGMFKTEVLRKHGFSDRTKVEDLDLTWTLVAKGYKVRQVNRCVVYPQECSLPGEEWKRWRRWIVGYAVCMRLHRRLLLTRFGVMSILPMMLVVFYGVVSYSIVWSASVITNGALYGMALALFPMLWMLAVSILALISAIHHKRFWLIPLAPFSIAYVLLSYSIWIIHGVKGLLTGREPVRDKPTRYSHVVG